MSEVLKDLIVGFVPVIVSLVGIFATVISGNKKTIAKVDKIDEKLDEHIKENDFDHAKECRVRILRFDDEICRGLLHTENSFEDILEDIDNYTKFCNAHKDFPNSKGELAMKHIKAVYEKTKDNGKFLTRIETIK